MTLLLKFFQRITLPDYIIWVNNRYVWSSSNETPKYIQYFLLTLQLFSFRDQINGGTCAVPGFKPNIFFMIFIVLQAFKFWSQYKSRCINMVFIKTFLLAEMYFWTFCTIWFTFKSYVKIFCRTGFFTIFWIHNEALPENDFSLKVIS